eukprot:365425-Chlamydomonas_euryale.AAC.14
MYGLVWDVATRRGRRDDFARCLDAPRPLSQRRSLADMAPKGEFEPARLSLRVNMPLTAAAAVRCALLVALPRDGGPLHAVAALAAQRVLLNSLTESIDIRTGAPGGCKALWLGSAAGGRGAAFSQTVAPHRT